MKLFYFCWLVFGCFTAFGQLEQAKRIEFEHNVNTEEEHQIIPLGTDGVLLMHSKVDYAQKNMKFNFYKYDTTLTENWHINFQPEDRYELAKTFENEHFLYLFFREDNTVNIGILRIDFETGDKAFTEGKLPMNMEVEEFLVLKSKALFGGKFNERPVVVAFSLFDSSTKVLPELHANDLIINELDINEQSENIYVMLKNEHSCQFILKIFSYEGKVLSSVTLGERSHNPISGKILPLNSTEMLLTGNYSEGCSIYSQGIYLHHLNEDKTQFVNFADLKNFFKYLKPKREQRIIDKINLKKQQGKEVKLRYRLLLHDIIPQEDGFLMIAEIFYPEYKSPSSTLFSNVRAYRIGTDVYNNFRYTHAIVCSFDKNGKLLWDNCFPLDDLESGELNEKVQVTSASNGLLVMAYPKEGVIKTEVIKGSQNARPIENLTLKPNAENERISESNRSNLAAWYDKNFLAYGYQTIKNEKNYFNTREVFYLNKLTYTTKNESE